MEELNPQQEIRLIREMIERTKKVAAGSWQMLIIWGVVAVIGVASMYGLVALERYAWIWASWVFWVAVGIVLSFVYGSTLERRSGVRTYSQNAAAQLAQACGVAFLLTGFVFPLLKLYTWGLIPVMISLVAGIMIFGFGGLLEWPFLKWCGTFFWLGSLAMAFVHENYRGLLFVPLIIVGYITPALVLRSKYRKQDEAHES
jgi:hypothetical protein